MALEDIIQKERTIYTPLAQEIADSPEEQERKFKFHVSTYVAIADMESRWNATLDNLLARKPATGLIYADTGYGKTSTGASLWHYAETKGIVAVPPFMWNSLADLLTAAHGWIRYRLTDRRPELLPDLDEKYRAVIAIGEETLAERMSRENRLSIEQARSAITFVKAEERFRDELSPLELLDYLRFATKQVLDSGYDGLLVIPDEFQLFKNNPDTAQNYDRLKQFIFGLHGGEKLPIGCVALTYNETFASIRESEYNYLLARFAEPAGNLINLENLYGETEFARHLWDKLAALRGLSSSEKSAIDNDVLDALGQFLRHSRSRALISGPRSVVETFRRAASHYTEKARPYNLFDFCEDYLAGNLTYSGQHTEAAQAHVRIMNLPDVNTPKKQQVVKLLCVHPEGVPPELFRKCGILDVERERFIDTLLPQHVTTKVIGPTLVCHRDDLHGVDSLTEILKRLKPFNPANRDVHRRAVHAFRKHLIPNIFTQRKQGTLLGWTSLQNPDENREVFTTDLRGTLPTLREYPNRTLTVEISTEKTMSVLATSETHFHARFILDTTSTADNTCRITEKGLEFRFDMQKSNPQIPADIGKLGDLFSPESITPLLLLSILDFFDKKSTISIVKGANQEAIVDSLSDRIRRELIRYFFSPKIKESAVEYSTELSSVPAGKDFVEGVLKVLIPKQFPDYHAVAIAKGWENSLGVYRDALNKGYSLGVKRGSEPIKGGSKLFNMGQVAFDNFRTGVARDLLKVEPGSGRGSDQELYFIRHPFEEKLLNRLEHSPSTILVDGKPVKTIKIPDVYQDAQNLGYLEDEIGALIEIIKARGMVDTRKMVGTEHLYLVENSINFAELKTKFKGLETDAELAESKGFQYRCDSLSSARVLTSTLGIEDDEVQKDTLRQKLNSAETHLKNSCAEWVITEQSHLERKIHELETLHLEVPRDLEPRSNYPLTQFSQILFQSIQGKVRLAYTRLSDNIRELQRKVQEICESEIQGYQAKATRPNAIETASRLRDACSRVDEKIEWLKEEQVAAQEQFGLFGKWRVLTSQIVTDRQLMEESAKDKNVANLIAKLDDVERKIRQHLADNRLSLTEVLSNHEYFKNLVEELKTEFDQFLGGKEKEFIADKAKLEEQLASVVDTSHIEVWWNPAASDNCYRETRDKAVEKLKGVIDNAHGQINNLKRDLLGPIEIFAVPGSLRSRAIQLRDDVSEYASEIQVIRTNLTSTAVDSKMSEWVEDLIHLRQKGEKILQRWQAIKHEQAEFESSLSPKAQKLRNALNPLLDDRTFSSPREILECLTELYRGKLD